ncbi:DUF397 domain-containing protein [Nocardia ninae]|uniref:DUF397 domain-containing protein n=1 Tax=Nocardia ninae NBRC 108245 TaxID=1210091 RepID=A0A511MHL3_9NOCA|nr:DUF397 domain-containing protein [Nocardia ninae]GEM39931.1 hypothetical protein NN4_44500 [Nocardia ninae NBRC 108245]
MITGVWRKATYSNNQGACVEVRVDTGTVSIRDSKYLQDPNNDPHVQPVISITTTQWTSILDWVAGRTSMKPQATRVEIATNGSVLMSTSDGTVTLAYTVAEWEAFTAGVRDGEFDPAVTHAA